MKRSICWFLAAASIAFTASGSAPATRPRYGGTLHVEVRAAVQTLEPADWPADTAVAAAKDKLVPMVFERLVELDENGSPAPSLGVSWQHDPEARRWQFRIRAGVRFHDGTPLTAEAAATSLNATAAAWSASASGDLVVIESEQPLPDLLPDLAQARHSIYLRGADGSVSGTGPFRLDQWQPGRRVVLKANEEHWAGRPFLDAVQVDMGRPLEEQRIDLELGRADVVELLPSDSARALQSGNRIWTSAPRELLALDFGRNSPTVEDGRVREAVALAIDRNAINSVLLQKQGQPSGALLPQWLSGYAFLFPVAPQPVKAKQLVSALAPRARTLSLGYDVSDPLARAVAERVAVNAREAGITLQVSGQPGKVQPPSFDVRLVRLTLTSLRPDRALVELAGSLGLSLPNLPAAPPTLEYLYQAERALVDDHRVIPIAWLPEIYAVGSQVKSWSTPGLLKSAVWRFGNLWLDAE